MGGQERALPSRQSGPITFLRLTSAGLSLSHSGIVLSPPIRFDYSPPSVRSSHLPQYP